MDANNGYECYLHICAGLGTQQSIIQLLDSATTSLASFLSSFTTAPLQCPVHVAYIYIVHLSQFSFLKKIISIRCFPTFT